MESGGGSSRGHGRDDPVPAGDEFAAIRRPSAARGVASEPEAAGSVSCPFLRSVEADGRLSEAQATAVAAHRCAAFGDPRPLSLSQQELVCLQRVYVSCPRFARGVLLAGDTAHGSAPEERQSASGSLLTLVGVALVILAVGVFLTALLGLPPLGGGSPVAQSPVAVASASTPRTPAFSAEPTATRTAESTPSALSSAPATAAITASPTARLTPTPAPTPVAASSWPPGATASRMSLLVPCPDQANCYLYTVRGPGANGSSVADTVAGIARFFGVDVSTIYAMNPGASAGIKPGEKLKIPPPTR